jgi:hypothetical protein
LGRSTADTFYRLPVGYHPLARTLNSLAGGALGEASPMGSGVEAAIDLILQHTVTIPPACGLLGRSGTEIRALVDRGELGGLCVDGDWFLSRRGAERLARLADAEKWAHEQGFQRYDVR